MATSNIQLVDKEDTPLYTRAMSLIGEKGDRAVNESPGFADEHPDFKIENAKVRM
jgi:hypothetical protein